MDTHPHLSSLKDKCLLELLRSGSSNKRKSTALYCGCVVQSKTSLDTLWCETCRTFEDKICGTKNFSAVWIKGSTNQKLSNVLDHAKSDQHKRSMSVMRIQQAKATKAPLIEYAPIARSLLSGPMDQATKEKMGRKFDICYMLAKENLAFRKYNIHLFISWRDVMV